MTMHVKDLLHKPCDGKLRSGPVYTSLLTVTGSPPSPFAAFVWGNRAPPRVQFFTWLLVQERIQCRSVLVRKNVLDNAECALYHHPEETCDHIIFNCPFSSQVWSALATNTTSCQVSTLWTIPRAAGLPRQHFHTFVLLICWQLWKHRNSVVFEAQEPSHRRFWQACRHGAALWKSRLPRADGPIAEIWCNVLSPM
ncbi:unnamed protein product [Urochloa humidicola]